MRIPGLVTLQAEEHARLDELSAMLGRCFLEEPWFAVWLGALDAAGVDESRKAEIAQSAIRCDYEATAPYGCVFALPDFTGGANAYRRSELGETTWAALEEKAWSRSRALLFDDERDLLEARAQKMEAISDTRWPAERLPPDEDFLYFVSIGIDAQRRGSGAFRKLLEPMLAYADEHAVPCCLDCYSDRLEGLYGRFGFRTLERKSDPAFSIVERQMMRRPQPAS